MIGSIIQLALSILMIVSMWKIFETFGQKGWACIIPFYNIIVMLRIVKWEPVKFWFFLIPIYNIYLSFLLYKDIAAKYGKGDNAYAIGLLLLPFIFFPLLAFKETPVAETVE